VQAGSVTAAKYISRARRLRSLSAGDGRGDVMRAFIQGKPLICFAPALCVFTRAFFSTRLACIIHSQLVCAFVGCAMAAFCISKFAELVRPGVTYGRLTDNIAHIIAHRAAAAVSWQKPLILILKRETLQPLCGSLPRRQFYKFLKSGWCFLFTGETGGSVLWERAGSRARSFYH
jgi:hypothetical protein